MINACSIPLCVTNITFGFVENLPGENLFVSFTDVATGVQKWIPAQTDADSILKADVSEFTEWFSQHKVYKIAAHELDGNSCPDYCITVQSPNGGELTDDFIIAGFVKVNAEITNYKLILR